MKKLIYYAAAGCPASYAFKAIEGKWKLPCLYVLCENGTLRYNEMKKVLGITNMMLTSTLKELEAEGLILRVQYNEIPPRVEYSLSDAGSRLIPIFHEFSLWGEYLMTIQKHPESQEE